MKSILLLLTLSFCLHAESNKWKWTRRTISFASCIASSIDGYQSARYLDGHHIGPHGGILREGNGFLANPDGTVNVARMIGWKLAPCLVPIVAGELLHDDWKPIVTIPAAALLGVSAFTAIHNYNIIRKSP